MNMNDFARETKKTMTNEQIAQIPTDDQQVVIDNAIIGIVHSNAYGTWVTPTMQENENRRYEVKDVDHGKRILAAAYYENCLLVSIPNKYLKGYRIAVKAISNQEDMPDWIFELPDSVMELASNGNATEQELREAGAHNITILDRNRVLADVGKGFKWYPANRFGDFEAWEKAQGEDYFDRKEDHLDTVYPTVAA